MLKKFGPRIYRDNSSRLPWQTALRCETSDIMISSSCAIDNERAQPVLQSIRSVLHRHIGTHPDFTTSLIPLPVPAPAPDFILDMYHAAAICGVGPLAAVAGAIAAELGRRLELPGEELVIENGGDIHLQGSTP
jgi:ApbE superfamily uncharacterized protein (UPF0280 family)